MLVWATVAATVLWIGVLVLPWRPWSTREHLRLDTPPLMRDLSEISVLIPARNEAPCIAACLQQLTRQGRFAAITVIDDQSNDGTGEIARSQAFDNLTVLNGSAPPRDWSGKLFALEQGLLLCSTPYILLLDADIGLRPGVIPALLDRLERDNLDMISIMASLHMRQFWEKLLLPPFVYFFKLIYPFALANSSRSTRAAGAGGCMLLRAESLCAIGGFAALKGAIIDDCTLAKRIKELPGRIWIGLSNDAHALRPYENLSDIWNMVARTAYTQLRYSPVWLLLCTILLVLSYIVPIAALFARDAHVVALATVAITAMLWSFLPTIRYFDLASWWALTLPLAAVLFLAMTWTSAMRYICGERSRWKNRSYDTA